MVTALLLAALALLAGRLVWIQVVQHPRWGALARKYHQSRRITSGRRGTILDRRGRKLAVTVPVPSVYANPMAIRDKERVARLLAKALDLSPVAVLERLQPPRYFVWIRRRITQDKAEAVRKLGVRGVGFREETLRVYPHGTLAAHVLGGVGVDNEGLAGLEQKFDRVLAGRPGFEMVLRDGRGRSMAVSDAYDRPAVNGRHLVLSLDAVIQQIAEEELHKAIITWEAVGGAVVVLEAGTSQVLAMASAPTFDPNTLGSADENSRLNRAVGMIYEPGSVYKSFVAAAALDCNIVRPDTRIFCYNGAHSFGGRMLRDTHPYGWLDVREVIVRSSNIGIAQVAARLGPFALHHAARRFGFGARTGIDLPGEEIGILHPARKWTNYSMTSVPMGQEIAVTPLAVAAGYNVFASDGQWSQPRLGIGMASDAGTGRIERFDSLPPSPVISPRVARLLRRDFLVAVVERGTGKRAQVAGYSVAGKTGTAQVARKDRRGYEPGAYIGSFVGIAPAEAPRVVCIVVVERPRRAHYGGTVAAPAVAAILERTLAYQGVPKRDTAATHAGGKEENDT